jgi:hypothetical protein
LAKIGRTTFCLASVYAATFFGAMVLPRALLLAVVLGLAGCASVPSTVSDRLFFGRAIPTGGEVTEAQWNTFVAEVITPRFPDGFTVWRGSGHWKGDDGAAVSEQTCVLEVVHGVDPTTDTKLDEIARAYRERFNQDAVMRIRTPAEQTFSRR